MLFRSLADTVQAASKSWESCSYSAIEVKISELIKHKIDDNQMAKCNLSFKDLNVIQQSFLDTIWASFHRRTKYPSQIAAEQKQASEEKQGAEEKLQTPEEKQPAESKGDAKSAKKSETTAAKKKPAREKKKEVKKDGK